MDPLNVDKYISRDYHDGLDDNLQRGAYERRDALINIGARVVEVIGQLHLWGFYMDVMFVGMRFHGDHTFQAADDVVGARIFQRIRCLYSKGTRKKERCVGACCICCE
jgi:hypothetical protein